MQAGRGRQPESQDGPDFRQGGWSKAFPPDVSLSDKVGYIVMRIPNSVLQQT